jgi:hypothetical protein
LYRDEEDARYHFGEAWVVDHVPFMPRNERVTVAAQHEHGKGSLASSAPTVCFVVLKTSWRLMKLCCIETLPGAGMAVALRVGANFYCWNSVFKIVQSEGQLSSEKVHFTFNILYC